MTLRGTFLYALLLVTAACFAVGTRASTHAGGEFASAGDHGGGGLAAVATWLRESGAEIRLLHASLEALPAGTSTVVVAAPTAARVSREEVEALERFVTDGGRLVYLRPASGQAELDGWLQAHEGGELAGTALGNDLGGATAQVSPALGLLSGLSSFRVGARRGITSGDAHFVPVAHVGLEPVLMWKPEGRGEVWVAAGADLAENRRLELADNRVFWARLAKEGPLAFDEYHHVAPPPPPMSLGLWAFALQAVLCAVLLALARGTHLGPPRSSSQTVQRRAVEYAESFGQLLRRARVEGELVGELEARLRRELHARAGIPLELPASEVEPRLRAHRAALAESWKQWWAARRALPGRITPASWWRLSRLGAELEERLRGGR